MGTVFINAHQIEKLQNFYCGTCLLFFHKNVMIRVLQARISELEYTHKNY